MRKLVLLALLPACAACGVETAGTAATGAAIKKQELESGREAMERAEQRIGQSLEAQQQRANAAGGADQ